MATWRSWRDDSLRTIRPENKGAVPAPKSQAPPKIVPPPAKPKKRDKSTTPPRSFLSQSQLPCNKPKKREKWLLTRKTWRYMADAGKLLIPESLRKGKDMKEYTNDELAKLEEHFNSLCDQQQEFIEWEGPRQDPRVLLAHNRVPRHGPDIADGIPKFRLVLPVGQEPPPGYIQVGTRTLPMGDLHDDDPGGAHDSYLQLPSGLLLQELPAAYLCERDWYARRSSSPSDSGILSPEDPSYGEDLKSLDEGGVGSGVDSGVGGVKRLKYRVIGIQTDPLPEEFYRLQEEEQRRIEEEKRRKEEEERLRKEAEEKAQRELEAAEATMMGDSVMRYSKMLRRNSKTSDQKKAERFRGMNYDPTLRNIKAKYLHKEETLPGYKKSIEIQVGESLLALLSQMRTPVDPPKPKKNKDRKISGSDFSESVGSPMRRYSVAEPLLPPTGDVERDFFSHLYSGDMTALEGSSVPEDYYNYLESWYRAQKGLHPTSAGGMTTTRSGPMLSSSSSIYIPVNALQNLRASMPTLATSVGVSQSMPCVSRSTSSLGKSPGQSFLSSVISKPFAGLAGSLSGSSSGIGHSVHGHAGTSSRMIISRKLWRPRSKSQGRSSISQWTPISGYRWSHVTNRQVSLDSTHLLLLHDFERVALQKVACKKLNAADPNVTVRIPKDTSDKPKRRSYLKKVLPRASKDKLRDGVPSSGNSGSGGPVFGVPLSQCVEATPWRKRSACTSTSTTGIDIPEITSPTASKASRSDSRISVGSTISVQDRISSPPMMTSATSIESLNTFPELRRASASRSSQSSAFDALFLSEEDGIGIASSPNSSTSPCVPTVVMMCIRHLEQFGLHTVGIFRVSSSKRRVRQLREEFNRGGEITLTVETGVHDVATLLKEFFRDLPEPILPKDLQPALLAIHKMSNPQDQISNVQRLLQILPVVNRDTLFVLLQFLGLVAENSDDRKAEDGTALTGNKMDTTNLATLFAPNLLHTFAEDTAAAAKQIGQISQTPGSISSQPTSPTISLSSPHKPLMDPATDRSDHVAVLRLLIEKRDVIFELPSVELNDVYLYLQEHFPDVLDALLRRRSALAGDEIPEDDEEDVEGDGEMRDGVDKIDHGNSEMSFPARGRARARKDESEGSECERSIASAPVDHGLVSSSSSRWSFKRKDRDKSDKRTSVDRSTTSPPSDDHGSGKSSLRFQMPGRKISAASAEVAQCNLAERKKSIAMGGNKTATVSSAQPPRRSTMMSSGGGGVSETRGTDTIVYSPASTLPSNRGTPSSELFFGSGTTSPSYGTSSPPPLTSPPSLASPPAGFTSPLLAFSPPISPPPLMQTLAVSSSIRPRSSIGVPSPSCTSPAPSDNTLVPSSPPPMILRPTPVGAESTIMQRRSRSPMVKRDESINGVSKSKDSELPAFSTSQAQSTEHSTQDKSSLLPGSPITISAGARLGGVVKAHSDNLEKYISEVEASSASGLEGDDQLGSPLGTQQKKYVRRRYTDTRHHTTELPDMSLEVAREVSVRNPPVRRKPVKPSDRPIISPFK